MKLKAIKTFRPMHAKGKMIRTGEEFTVSEEYGRDLLLSHMAIIPEEKAIAAYENKMVQDYANKGMITSPESIDERAQGKTGPTAKSETPEQRNQGKWIKADTSKSGSPK